MESGQLKKKKKNRTPVLVLASFLLVFSGFIFLITRPSEINVLINQIQACSSIEEVKKIYLDNKAKYVDTDVNGRIQVSVELQNAVRDKLNSFDLSDVKLKECLEWIPQTRTNLNLIVIPDLSNRLDTSRFPGQVARDIYLIYSIWSSFVDQVRLKLNSNDRIIVQITDPGQAAHNFEKFADSLLFNLSSHRSKSNRLYFTADKTQRFKNAVDSVYKYTIANPFSGADFTVYVRRSLSKEIRKPTIYDNYKNKVIILTDGYLEAGTPDNITVYTKFYKYENQLRRAVIDGNIRQVIDSNNLNIRVSGNVDLTGVEILICEVNERKSGLNFDYEILSAYWCDWLERMNVKSTDIHFHKREDAITINENQIKNFIAK